MDSKARIVYKDKKGDTQEGTIQGRNYNGYYVLPDKKKRQIHILDSDVLSIGEDE